jgi:hypothetical protein
MGTNDTDISIFNTSQIVKYHVNANIYNQVNTLLCTVANLRPVLKAIFNLKFTIFESKHTN